MAIIYGRAQSEKELLKKYPDRVKTIKDISRVREEMKNELKVKDDGFFSGIRRWNKQRQISKFEKNKDSPFQAGARGELQVLDELSKLSDEYHVLCGVNVELSYGRRTKSAQIDFVVVSKKGVIMIEVKNWSSAYAKSHNGFNPYSQTQRAGQVLWVFLKSWRFNPRVTSVLLSIQGNMEYDPNHKAVFVSSLYKINDFIKNRPYELSDKDINKVVRRLKNKVTK